MCAVFFIQQISFNRNVKRHMIARVFPIQFFSIIFPHAFSPRELNVNGCVECVCVYPYPIPIIIIAHTIFIYFFLHVFYAATIFLIGFTQTSQTVNTIRLFIIRFHYVNHKKKM